MVRIYVHNPTGLQYRHNEIDTRFPLEKKEFAFTIEYANETGKKFYSVFIKTETDILTKLFVFKPKIKINHLLQIT